MSAEERVAVSSDPGATMMAMALKTATGIWLVLELKRSAVSRKLLSFSRSVRLSAVDREQLR
jgi:hypothetical protein